MLLKDKFVRVRPRTRCEVVGDEIAGLGFPRELADRIATCLIDANCLPQEGQLREFIQSVFWELFEKWSSDADPDVLALLILRRLLKREYGTEVLYLYQENPTQLDAGSALRFVEAYAKADGTDFTATLGRAVAILNALGDRHNAGLEVAQVLWRHKLVQPERLIDLAALARIAKATSLDGGSWTGEETASIRSDVRSPGFWMAVDPKAAIQGLSAALDSLTDEDLAWCARGVNICATQAVDVTGFRTASPPVQEVIKFAFDAVDRRIGPDARATLPLLRRTWMYLWRELWWRYKLAPDSDRDSRLLAAADMELGSLRPVIEKGDQASFVERLPFIDLAVTCAFELAPLWEATRGLLLAFRKLPVPGVASDLRWWSDPQHLLPELPDPWYQLAAHIVGKFHVYVGREQESDLELTAFRTALARFSLDRLKTRESGDGPREEDPTWRLGYIAAVEALSINPEGKGHHTLHHVAQRDPHPEVRAAAENAYSVLRHGPKLKAGESPRRAVLLAFWYLRQAHLAALGVPIDERGANRIREEEVRRTTEREQPSTVPNQYNQ